MITLRSILIARCTTRRLVACLALCLVPACSNDKGPKPSRTEQATTTVNATVEAIDHDKRTVTVRGPAGGVVTLKADESVKNFSRLNVGDQVRAVYHESLTVRVRKPGDPPEAPAAAAAGSDAAGPAEGGAGRGVPVASRNQTVTATVEAIDIKRSTVVLKSPAGRTPPLRVQDPTRLENVNIGDQVDITYTESVAVSLEKIGEGGR
jgi:hypothetical protein